MKKKHAKIVLTKDGKKVAVCAAAGVALLALLLFFILFKVDSVDVVGSTRYSDEEIRQMALGSPLDSNTLLAVWFHRHQEAEDIAFVDSFDLEMLGPHAIRIHVNEKDIIGYVAQDGQKMYFDKDGNVVETEAQEESEILDPEAALQELETLRQEAEAEEAQKAEEEDGEDDSDEEDSGEENGTLTSQVQILEPEVSDTGEEGSGQSRAAVTDVPLILGLDMQNVRLGEKITVKDDGVFNTILGITRMVEKYQILPESVCFDEAYNITLVYNDGRLQCQLGQDTLLEEKITRVAALLPKLQDRTGILHLEDYTEDTVNLFFSEESLYTLKLALARAEGILDNADSLAETEPSEETDTATGAGQEATSEETDTATGAGQEDTSGETDTAAGTGQGEPSGEADTATGATSGETDTAADDGQAEDTDTASGDSQKSDEGQTQDGMTGAQQNKGTAGSSPGVRDLVGG